jgi:hypothetical protein
MRIRNRHPKDLGYVLQPAGADAVLSFSYFCTCWCVIQHHSAHAQAGCHVPVNMVRFPGLHRSTVTTSAAVLLKEASQAEGCELRPVRCSPGLGGPTPNSSRMALRASDGLFGRSAPAAAICLNLEGRRTLPLSQKPSCSIAADVASEDLTCWLRSGGVVLSDAEWERAWATNSPRPIREVVNAD